MAPMPRSAQTPSRPRALRALHKGRLEWRLLLDWLHEDGWITADDVERVSRRLSAGTSTLHALVRLGGAGLVRSDAAGAAKPLDIEALTDWVAGCAKLAYLRIDPLRADVGRVAEVMPVQYAESRRALPVKVGPTEVTIATAEPFDVGWVTEIENHLRRHGAAWWCPAPTTCAATPPSSTPCRAQVRAAQKSRRSQRAPPASSSWSNWARPRGSSTPTTRAWCRWSTGCGSTPSISAPATSTSSRGATWAPSAFASTACCTRYTRCR